MMQGIALTVEKISSHLKINELQKDIGRQDLDKNKNKKFFIYLGI